MRSLTSSSLPGGRFQCSGFSELSGFFDELSYNLLERGCCLRRNLRYDWSAASMTGHGIRLVEGMRHYTTFQMHAAATSLVNGCNMPAGSTGLEIDTGASGKPASTR